MAALVIFMGAGLSMGLAWSIADIFMGFMCLINIPTCIILGKVAYAACRDYVEQKQMGRDPIFRAKNIGMDSSKLDYWQREIKKQFPGFSRNCFFAQFFSTLFV